MKKFKLFFAFEKEEHWLEKMAAQGYLFERKALCYHFKKVNPQNAAVKIDYRKFKNNHDFFDYVSMFEDSGWKHISGTKSSGVQYFMPAEKNSSKDIFTDVRSRAGRYRRISNMWLMTALYFAILFIILASQNMVNFQNLLTPKDWYLTPGLWEMEGLSFLWCFLFETPFALFRECSWLFCILFIFLYSMFALKSSLLYRESLKDYK